MDGLCLDYSLVDGLAEDEVRRRANQSAQSADVGRVGYTQAEHAPSLAEE